MSGLELDAVSVGWSFETSEKKKTWFLNIYVFHLSGETFCYRAFGPRHEDFITLVPNWIVVIFSRTIHKLSLNAGSKELVLNICEVCCEG